MNSAASTTAELPRLERGQRLTLTLTAWGRLGEALAIHEGQEIFVFGGIPGERVEAEITSVRRKYLAAQVVSVIEPHPDRVAPTCGYFGACTGCQWQHIAYPRQLAVKTELVADALRRVGGFSDPPVLPAIASPRQLGYRNHARFTTRRDGSVGFVHRETHRFTRIDRCQLMHDGVNNLLAQAQGRSGETTQLAIRMGQDTGDFLVQPAFRNPEIAIPTGQKTYMDSIAGRKFRVASPSFFQVNVAQAAQMVSLVSVALNLGGGETLLDAYAGVGTFAILLAPRVGRVIAVEESPSAVADARENAAGLSNITFLAGKTEDVLPALAEKPEVVILDPPRAGCQPAALEALIRLAPPRVVYVSCDPETLGRDLKILCREAYTLEQVQPFDMFPQTYHVECVATLRRREPPPLILASGSPRRRELLAGLGVAFTVLPSDAPEEQLPGESAEEMARRLSRLKVETVAARVSQGYIIGADSSVVFNGLVYGKPLDDADARRMLRELRGTAHQVVTGVTVLDAVTGRSLTESHASPVQMRDYTDAEIEATIASGMARDKAGAYAIQDAAFHPARLLEGCYSNVVGLPICRVVAMLQALGCPLPPLAQITAATGCIGPCPFERRRPL